MFSKRSDQLRTINKNKYGASKKILIKTYRRAFNYWYPGTNIIDHIINAYINLANNGDFLIISEKALAIAYGYIYNEDLIGVDKLTYLLTKIITKYVWSFLLRRYLHDRTIQLLNKTPLMALAAHKKLALVYGGFLQFIKPVSEAGIDTKNLPYHYVALPLSNANYIVKVIHEEFLRMGKYVNVMIVDTDRAFRFKKINGIAISTRGSFVKGIINLGGVGYLVSKVLRRYVTIYPTPVAYEGVRLSLPLMLMLAKKAVKIMGEGFGRDSYEMLKVLNKKDFNEVTWIDMKRIRHYPAVLLKIKVIDKPQDIH